MKGKRKIITLMLVLSLIAVSIPKQVVIAAEDEEEPQTYEVSDLGELITAINNASEDDTISITSGISISYDVSIGNESKHLTIKRNTSEIPLKIGESGIANVTFKNLTFDGEGQSTETAFIQVKQGSAIFNSCILENCGSDEGSESALIVNSGSAKLNGCTLVNNKADNGGSIRATSGYVELNGSVVTGCHAYEKGGGIYNGGNTTFINSLIYGNTADVSGNDVYSTGTLSRNTDIETMTTILNDDTKTIEGWKDEGSGDIINPLTVLESEKALTLVVTSLEPEQQPEPSPGTNDSGKDNKGEESGNTTNPP